MMMFTNEAIDKIDKAKFEWLRKSEYKVGLGVNAHNGVEAGVYINGDKMCDLDELEQLIAELNAVREILINEIGIIC